MTGGLLTPFFMSFARGFAGAICPHDLGDDSTANRWLIRWYQDGTWARIWLALLDTLDEQIKLNWESALLDGSFVPAKKGGEDVAIGGKGKGSTIHLIAESRFGIPLAFVVTSAAVHETRVACAVVDAIHVQPPIPKVPPVVPSI